jgi:hypothetical protein
MTAGQVVAAISIPLLFVAIGLLIGWEARKASAKQVLQQKPPRLALAGIDFSDHIRGWTLTQNAADQNVELSLTLEATMQQLENAGGMTFVLRPGHPSSSQNWRERALRAEAQVQQLLRSAVQ